METTTIATTAWIGPQSRNLGLGWTTAAIDGPGGWRIAQPSAPAIEDRGGPAAVRREQSRLRAVVSGGAYYHAALFVGDQRITHWRESERDGWTNADDDDGQLLSRVMDGFREHGLGYDGNESRVTRVQVRLA